MINNLFLTAVLHDVDHRFFYVLFFAEPDHPTGRFMMFRHEVIL
jgi:hypothetical protein